MTGASGQHCKEDRWREDEQGSIGKEGRRKQGDNNGQMKEKRGEDGKCGEACAVYYMGRKGTPIMHL